MIGRRNFLKAGLIFGAGSVAGPALAVQRGERTHLQLLIDGRFREAIKLARNSNVLTADGSSALRIFRGGTDLTNAQAIIREAGSVPLVGVTRFSDRLIFEGLARQMGHEFHLVSDERPANGRLAAGHWNRLERDMIRRLNVKLIPAEWKAIVMRLAQERGAGIWLALPGAANEVR